jgi:hypothetical protein
MSQFVPFTPESLSVTSLPGLPSAPDRTFPAYEGYSIANLPGSICAWLGVPPPEGTAPPLAEPYHQALNSRFRRVVVLVVDGLGWHFAQQRGGLALAGVTPVYTLPLTSIVPSTTATALTTLWTGTYPARHGILGYEMWLKEYGLIANMILHNPASYNGDFGSLRLTGFDPETFLSVPVLAPHLASYGVRTLGLMHVAIARSGLSQMLMRGCDILPFRNSSDLWVTLEHLLDESSNRTSYIYAYWGDLDELAHRFGPEDARVDLEFNVLRLLLQRLLQPRLSRRWEDTLFLVVADHGFVPTPRNARYELRQHPQLKQDLLMPPSGENRLPYLFPRPGRAEDVRAYVESAWPGEFDVITTQQAVQSGLFGPGQPNPLLYERLGEWVLLPRGQAYLWWANKENSLLGRHGGLHPHEMLVPLCAWVL